MHLIAQAGSLATLALMAAGLAVPAYAASATPITEVKTVVNQALKILRSDNIPVSQRRQQLRQVVADHFDFIAMSRSAIGYHWRDLAPQQRKDFVAVFTEFIEDSYLSKIQDYKGQGVAVLRQTQDGPDYARVYSKIVQKEKPPIAVNYMLKRNSGAWKIYDVTVDDISIIANYRNQFNRVINNKGFDTLMSELRRKQQQLAASLSK